MTFQVSKEGDVTTGEFSEVSYAGTGDGSTNYINTGINADEITTMSIKFKYKPYSSAYLYESLWGCVENSYTEYFWCRQDATVMYVYIGNSSAPIWNISGVMIEDNIYTITLTKSLLARNTWTVTVYNHTTGAQVYSSTQLITGTIPSIPVHIYARNLNNTTPNNYVTKQEIYWFEINGETWYINNGTGTTLTGTNGTELTISGTTTNFWTDTTEWNYPTNLKAFKEADGKYIAGVGNGSDINVKTSVAADDVDYLEMKFKHSDTGLNCLFGSLTSAGGNNRYYLAWDGSLLRVGLGDNLNAINLTSYVSFGNIYTIKITHLGSYLYNVVLLDANGSELYNGNYQSNSCPSNNLYIFCYNTNADTPTAPTENMIYYFKINNETWYINDGEGTTITGDKGTTLTINGTLTNFWAESTIYNAPYGKIASKEFIEDYTYTGAGNGTDISITTAIRPIDITSMSMIFKYSTYENLNAYFGSLTDANNRFVLYKYTGTNSLSFAGGSNATLFVLTSYVTLGNIYKIDLSINGTDIHLDFYEWNTSTEEFDLKYSGDKTLPAGTTFGTSPIRIFNRSYLSNNYWVEDNIYMVKINDETWYFNAGTGNTVTGSKGTVWNIDGTLTNFWQPSDIPNLDAQMKAYETQTKVKREMIEV